MEAFKRWAREPLGQASPSAPADTLPAVGLSKAGSSRVPGESLRVASTGAGPPRANSSTETSRTSAFSGPEDQPSGGGSLALQRDQRSPIASSNRTSNDNMTDNVFVEPRVCSVPDRNAIDNASDGSRVSSKPLAPRKPSTSSVPSTASASPGSGSTVAASSGSSDRGGTGKRRMLLDADVRCTGEGERHERILYVDSHGAHETEPPVDGNQQRHRQEREAQHRHESAEHAATTRRDNGGRDVARRADDAPRSGLRGVGGKGSAPRRQEQNERPSTPAPTPRGKQQGAALTTTGDDRLGRGLPVGRASSSAHLSAPLDTVMEDHDRFDELSAADDAAFARAAASIHQVTRRQLAVREGFARCHSRLLQRDTDFDTVIKADKLVEGARSLLEDMGLVEESEAAGQEPMDAEEDEQEEEAWAFEQETLEQPLPPPPPGVAAQQPQSRATRGAHEVAGRGDDDGMDVADTHE